MKFIVDTQLPPALANRLTKIGHNSTHTSFYTQGVLFSDLRITQVAIEEDRIIVTKDSDFLERFLVKGSPPEVLLLQVGNTSNRELLELMEQSLGEITRRFNDGSALVILNKNSIIFY